MAYGSKWKFIFNSTNGVETTVWISKNGYSGSVTTRALGKAPVIRQSMNGCIKSNSLSLQVECQVDGEFSEFYTTDPREFRVQVLRSSTVVFEGFLVTEIFSEPLIATPYDVSINAVDGLSELKMIDFTPTGSQKLVKHLKNLLDQTGTANAIEIVSDLRFGMGSAIDFVKYATIDLDYLDGKNCYEVLEYLLTTIHATVQLYNGRWLIIRENDVDIDTQGSISCYFMNRSEAISSTSVPYVTAAITKMRAIAYWSYRPNMWPVGYLTRRVDPAKKSITIEAPWNVNDKAMLPSVENDGWTYSGSQVSFDSTHKCYTFNVNTQGGYVAASANVVNSNYDIEIKVRVSRASGGGPNAAYLSFTVALIVAGVGTFYYSEGNGWSTSSGTAGHVDVKNTNYDMTGESADEYTFLIPAAFQGGGTLTISFGGSLYNLFSATAEVKMNKGYKDTLLINNGARGEADTVEIGGGRVTSDTVMSLDSLQGIWLNSSTVAFQFSDGQGHTNKDFLSIMALDYARSIAAPRLRIQGVLDVPPASLNAPLVLRYAGAMDYLIETYEWDLMNDEITVDALALPTVTLQVTSENIKPLE